MTCPQPPFCESTTSDVTMLFRMCSVPVWPVYASHAQCSWRRDIKNDYTHMHCKHSADGGVPTTLSERERERQHFTHRTASAEPKPFYFSATGTRTRAARVRAKYPNQLDYSGVMWFMAWNFAIFNHKMSAPPLGQSRS